MDRLTQALADHAGTVLAAAILMILVLAVVCLMLALRLRRLASAWRLLLDGADGRNVERLLREHFVHSDEVDRHVESILGRLDSLEARMATAKRYVGLVKFNAFDDVGGDQSFALAIYDERGNGAVVSSLVGRSDCRVYCKELVEGKAARGLGEEEEMAIREAAKVRVKAGGAV